MNVLKNSIGEFLKVTINLPPVRHAKTVYQPLIPANYPVKWIKPVKTPCYTPQKSGDLGLEIDVTPNDYVLHCENSKELETANDIVKKMFTLHYHPKKETAKLLKDKIIKKIQRHKYDTTSPEVKIAVMTLKINLLQQCMDDMITNKKQKIFLMETIFKRNKQLKLIRNIDYRLYEWLLEKLNLFYRIPLEDPHEKVTKKGTIRMMTQEFCQKMIQDKLDAYKQELEFEKKTFYKEKLEKLVSIKEQEISLGLEPTVTDEDIVKAEADAKLYNENLNCK